MVKTLDNQTLDGPQQIVFLAYHKSKLSTEFSPLSNWGYPVSGSVEIITKFERQAIYLFLIRILWKIDVLI
jgi:hypothetical protein